MAVIPIDLHFEKDHQQTQKVRIRREGKIKEIGTVLRDQLRFQGLHIGLSTAVTVPPKVGTARRVLGYSAVCLHSP